MAVLKPVLRSQNVTGQPEDVTMPVFAYSNEGLAKLIVDLWKEPQTQRKVLEREPGRPKVPTPAAVAKATQLVNEHGGFKLKRAVVITEQEHDDDYVMQDENEVVFVLPNASRVVDINAQRRALLKTAQMLMACTPNGI